MKKCGLLIGLFFFTLLSAIGGDFTRGNIVVVRVGDGSAAPTNAAQPVYLDEYTLTGTFVQSVALPVSSSGNNHAFTLSGTATSEGALTLSANGNYLQLAGYDTILGVPSVSTISGVNRTIALIDSAGVVNTSTGITPLIAYLTNNIRGAVSVDGTAFWCSGAGTSSSGGTWYLPYGSFTSTPLLISSTLNNTRVINIFDGQLYVSAGTNNFKGINSVGNGVPAVTGETTTNLPGFPATDANATPYGFYMLDLDAGVSGVDVAYMVDDRTASPNGGIYKYSLVSGTWVLNGNIPSTSALRGLTASKNGSTVTLFATSETGIFNLTDASGYNQPITGSLNQVSTAATNTRIRGIAFTPQNSAISTGVQKVQPPDEFMVVLSGENLLVTGSGKTEKSFEVQLFDLNGRSLFSSTLPCRKEFNENISVASLSSGLYIVSVIAEGMRVNRKVLITR